VTSGSAGFVADAVANGVTVGSADGTIGTGLAIAASPASFWVKLLFLVGSMPEGTIAGETDGLSGSTHGLLGARLPWLVKATSPATTPRIAIQNSRPRRRGGGGTVPASIA
jgi:hypothetical protein